MHIQGHSAVSMAEVGMGMCLLQFQQWCLSSTSVQADVQSLSLGRLLQSDPHTIHSANVKDAHICGVDSCSSPTEGS